MLLHKCLEESARTYPKKIALVQKEERWTYRAIDEKANQVAHLLRNQPPVSSAVHSQFIPGSEIDILSPVPETRFPTWGLSFILRALLGIPEGVLFPHLNRVAAAASIPFISFRRGGTIREKKGKRIVQW